ASAWRRPKHTRSPADASSAEPPRNRSGCRTWESPSPSPPSSPPLEGAEAPIPPPAHPHSDPPACRYPDGGSRTAASHPEARNAVFEQVLAMLGLGAINPGVTLDDPESASGGALIASTNPATGEPLASVRAARAADLEQVVDRAHRAFAS